MKRCGLLAGLVFYAQLGLVAQQQSQGVAPSQPVFEVASIRPNKTGPGSSGITTNKGLIKAENVTLKRLIRAAYNLPESQISGGPDWIEVERFDINAKSDRPANDAELMQMLQALLAERFHLEAHPDKRQLAGYALVVDRAGFRAKPSAVDAHSSTSTHNSSNNGVRSASVTAVGATMERLASVLSDNLRVPIEDQTHVDGQFDFSLSWVPDDLQARDSAGPSAELSSGVSLFTALREQLGLRLESRKVLANVLVIDHVEPPTGN